MRQISLLLWAIIWLVTVPVYLGSGDVSILTPSGTKCAVREILGAQKVEDLKRIVNFSFYLLASPECVVKGGRIWSSSDHSETAAVIQFAILPETNELFDIFDGDLTSNTSTDKLGLAFLFVVFGLTVYSLRKHRIIVVVPGTTFRSGLKWLYSKKTLTRIFEPVLADMQEEWYQAVLENEVWRARWIVVRGYYGLFAAMGTHSVFSFFGKLFAMWKAG